MADLLDDWLDELREVRAQIADLKAREKELLGWIWREAGTRGSRRFGTYKATFVRSQRSTVDEDGVRKALPASVWHRLTKEVLDPVKVEKALVEGDLDPVVIQMHTKVTTVNQIRISGAEGDNRVSSSGPAPVVLG